MPNRRIIFSSQLLAFAPEGSTSYTELHGGQQIGMNTNMELTQVFEISNQSIYENIEGSPDVQINITKVLDGYCPAYLLATVNASAATLVARSAQKCMFGLAVFDDTVTAATGIPVRQCIVSGATVGSIAYNFNADGNFTEDITLQATDKIWTSGNFLLQNFTMFANDQPRSLYGSGGVNRREDFLWASSALTGVNIGLDANGQVNTNEVSIFPPDIDGINSSGLNVQQSDGSFTAHVQSASVSANFAREDLFELGKKSYFARFANPLVEVTTAISTLGLYGDGFSVNDVGYLGNGNNLRARTIKFRCREGLYIDCGIQNKISSVEYGGGDAGGGNVTITYNYTNFNDMTVQHPADVTTALRINGSRQP